MPGRPTLSLAFVTAQRTTAATTSTTVQKSKLYSVQRTTFEPRPLFVEVTASEEEAGLVPASGRCLATTLPQELMDMVLTHLSAHDTAQFRATCRAAEVYAQAAFAAKTFGEVSIHITAEHLQSLGEAVRQPQYVSQVKELRVYSHIRSTPLADQDAALLSTELARLLKKMAKLNNITIIGEHFAGSPMFDVPPHRLFRSGINCDMRLLIKSLQNNGLAIPSLTVENLNARHKFTYSQHNTGIQTLRTMKFTSGPLSGPELRSSLPGGYSNPAHFVDSFKYLTHLSFSGQGHQTHGCEMAAMLNSVHLPGLVKVSLSDSSIYHMDVLIFCKRHQQTITEIELTRLTLRSYRLDHLIKDIIEIDPLFDDDENDDPLDLAKLNVVRINRVCEGWHFERPDESHDDVHRSVHINHTDDRFRCQWKDGVLVVPGRANADYVDFFEDEKWPRIVVSRKDACQGAYYMTRDIDDQGYKPVADSLQPTLTQELLNGDQSVDGTDEFSGEADGAESDWWEYN